jgi:tripartite-type tricarboxylate transporter receptor subunit TctC
LVGARMTHVPYKVTANLVTDLISGQAPVSFQLVPNVRGPIKAGQVKPLVVAAAKRLTALPEVPTAAEAGIKGYISAAWFAFIAPAGTPRAAVDKLYKTRPTRLLTTLCAGALSIPGPSRWRCHRMSLLNTSRRRS